MQRSNAPSSIAPRNISFTKAHSLQNDFVILSAQDLAFFSAQQIVALANRYTGIGCDQVLGLEKCHSHHYRYTIYNPDGTEATQCINGMRAIAHLLFQQAPGVPILTLENTSGSFQAKRTAHGDIALYVPVYVAQKTQHTIDYAGSELTIDYLTCGNAHALIAVPYTDGYPLSDLAAYLKTIRPDTDAYNISIYEKKSAQRWISRTYERGAKETQACGSAAIALAIHSGITDRLTIEQKGGKQHITRCEPHTLEIIAPAALSYTGTIRISCTT